MRPFLIVLLCIAAFVALLFLLKIKILVFVDDNGKRVDFYLCGIKLGRKNKQNSQKKNADKSKDEKDKQLHEKVENVKLLFVPAAKAFGRIRRKLLIKDLHLDLGVAADDPAATAIAFGAASALAGSLLGFFKFNFKLKNERVNIYPDFQSAKSRLIFECKVILTFADALYIALAFLADYAVQKLKSNKKNKNKGGAENE